MKYFRKFFSPSVSFILFQVVTLVFNVLIVNFFLQPYLLDKFPTYRPFLEKMFNDHTRNNISSAMIIFLQIPFYFLGLKLCYGMSIWKKYHHNKKIFILGYLLSYDDSLYDKELSQNKQIKHIEQKMIKIDHLRSKLFLFNLIIFMPSLFLNKYFWDSDQGVKELKILLNIFNFSSLCIYLCVFFFLPFQSKKLLEQKLLLESEM